jgi:hypothetical protein
VKTTPKIVSSVAGNGLLPPEQTFMKGKKIYIYILLLGWLKAFSTADMHQGDFELGLQIDRV